VLTKPLRGEPDWEVVLEPVVALSVPGVIPAEPAGHPAAAAAPFGVDAAAAARAESRAA
jgi:hypothetical protein